MGAETLAAISALPVALATAWVTWWLSRRKEQAQTHSTIADGAETAVGTILLVMQELRREMQEINAEAELLREENKRLRAMVLKLERRVEELLKELGK
jgi:hypothetical protein